MDSSSLLEDLIQLAEDKDIRRPLVEKLTSLVQQAGKFSIDTLMEIEILDVRDHLSSDEDCSKPFLTSLIDKEKRLISMLLELLGVPEDDRESLLSPIYQNNALKFEKIDVLLPLVLRRFFQNNLPESYAQFWLKISDILELISLENTKFIENFIKSRALGDTKLDSDSPISFDGVCAVIDGLFGSIEIYQMIKTTDKLLSNVLEIEYEYLHHKIDLSLKVAYMPSLFQDCTLIQRRMGFVMSSTGVTGSTKGFSDSICIFSRCVPDYPFYDIPFPENDTEMEVNHAIIISHHDNHMLADTSESGSVAFMIKDGDTVLLSVGSILRFSYEYIVTVEDIIYPDQSEEDKEEKPSVIVLRHIDAKYPGKVYRFKTHDPRTGKFRKSAFVIGRGGHNERTKEHIAPDLPILGDPGISRKHAVISCIKNSWYVHGNKTENGTFLYLKTFDQFERKEPSEPMPIFQRFPTPDNPETNYNNRIICIGHYRFFLSRHN